MKYTVKRAMSLTLLTAILMSVVSCGSEGTPADRYRSKYHDHDNCGNDPCKRTGFSRRHL